MCEITENFYRYGEKSQVMKPTCSQKTEIKPEKRVEMPKKVLQYTDNSCMTGGSRDKLQGSTVMQYMPTAWAAPGADQAVFYIGI